MKIHQTILIILFVSLWASTLALGTNPNKDNKLTKKQKAAGWQMLFDGKTLEGWSIKSGKATYNVEEGTIVGTTTPGSPNTFLCSKKEFDDFELTFEVKFDQFFNSGVQIRAKLRGDKYGGRVYGPQIEIEKSPGQAGFIYGEAAGAWQSPEPKSKDEKINSHNHFRNDKWNKYHILAVGQKIQTWINGKLVADLNYDIRRYSDNTEGFIGLQVHGVGNNQTPMSVRWKNIYIRPIKNNSKDNNGKNLASLFNGKDFDGWSFHLTKEGLDNQGTFKVENEVITCSGDPRGYIYTNKTYSNYILKYDWAFDRPENLKADSLFRGNNGCLIHIAEKNTLGVWPKSIEVQGMHKQAGLILPIPRSLKCERTYDKNAYRRAINSVGRWNTTVIDVKEGNMLIRLNGIVVSTVKDSELTSGPIGLQSEGASLRWKNVKILER